MWTDINTLAFWISIANSILITILFYILLIELDGYGYNEYIFFALFVGIIAFLIQIYILTKLNDVNLKQIIFTVTTFIILSLLLILYIRKKLIIIKNGVKEKQDKINRKNELIKTIEANIYNGFYLEAIQNFIKIEETNENIIMKLLSSEEISTVEVLKFLVWNYDNEIPNNRFFDHYNLFKIVIEKYGEKNEIQEITCEFIIKYLKKQTDSCSFSYKVLKKTLFDFPILKYKIVNEFNEEILILVNNKIERLINDNTFSEFDLNLIIQIYFDFKDYKDEWLLIIEKIQNSILRITNMYFSFLLQNIENSISNIVKIFENFPEVRKFILNKCIPEVTASIINSIIKTPPSDYDKRLNNLKAIYSKFSGIMKKKLKLAIEKFDGYLLREGYDEPLYETVSLGISWKGDGINTEDYEKRVVGYQYVKPLIFNLT